MWAHVGSFFVLRLLHIGSFLVGVMYAMCDGARVQYVIPLKSSMWCCWSRHHVAIGFVEVCFEFVGFCEFSKLMPCLWCVMCDVVECHWSQLGATSWHANNQFKFWLYGDYCLECGNVTKERVWLHGEMDRYFLQFYSLRLFILGADHSCGEVLCVYLWWGELKFAWVINLLYWLQDLCVSVEDGLEFGWIFAITSSSIEFRWPILGFCFVCWSCWSVLFWSVCGLAHVGIFCYGVIKEHVCSFVEWLSCGYHCAWVCHCGGEAGHGY